MYLRKKIYLSLIYNIYQWFFVFILLLLIFSIKVLKKRLIQINLMKKNFKS